MRLVDVEGFKFDLSGLAYILPTDVLTTGEYFMRQLRGLPSAEPKQRWIPVKERLPEENGVYLASYEDATVLLEWFNGKWFFYPSNPAREETGTILAWMPLPEPYKEDEQC